MYQPELNIDENGFYGNFGGAFVPDMLKPNLKELKEAFYKYADDADFKAELARLLRDYAGRPTPLFRADRLSETYGINLYLKREDLCHTGAHKINHALGQALLAKRMGKTHLIAETGAGQHGVATATVAALMGMKCTVFMGAVDMERQKPNVDRMRLLGADVVAATSGGATLTSAVDTALNFWVQNPECYYLLGSAVGPAPYPEIMAHFQQVISQEMRRQLKEQTGKETPDAVIACIGGGSNASGAFFHFIDDKDVRLIGAEAAGKGIDTDENAATLTLGKEGVIHGMRTIFIQNPDGSIKEPYSISAGLDYPGIGPLHAHLASTGREEVVAITDEEALKAARQLAQIQGIIPAMESSHALAVLDRMKFPKGQTIVINLSGRGDKDLSQFNNE